MQPSSGSIFLYWVVDFSWCSKAILNLFNIKGKKDNIKLLIKTKYNGSVEGNISESTKNFLVAWYMRIQFGDKAPQIKDKIV